MSAPQIPERPARSHEKPSSSTTAMPTIPPRPSRRGPERPVSPSKDHFARSPFHEPPNGMSAFERPSSVVEAPERPPSVALPSIGQEGAEYADLNTAPAVSTPAEAEPDSPAARIVAGDLPLHAPVPSLSKNSATQRLASVTQSGSTHDAERADTSKSQTLRPKVSFRTTSEISQEPSSAGPEEDEHGIPTIGQRVPMMPDAGDVQAPSPSPLQQQFPAGIGFHNSGIAKQRPHRRTPSGRDVMPPGSYGMHGHGLEPADRFEKDWYAKHPDALEREEHGEYGPGIGGGRGEWAMSSDDLNKLVRQTALERAAADSGLPNEQIGYAATEQYSSRAQTPHSATFKSHHTSGSQSHVQSPLRKSSFPVETDAHAKIKRVQSHDPLKRYSNDHAVASETDDDDLYVSAPAKRQSKYTGDGYDAPTMNLGPTGGNTDEQGGLIEETGYGVPILASDEVARTPGTEYLQPAISPTQSRRGSSNYASNTGQDYFPSRPSSARPTSRHGAPHGLTLPKQTVADEEVHTPLEDVEEYEPLFSDDEDGEKKPQSAAQRLQLQEKMKRFPSQDIWEDAPTSLQLQATVDTPEPIGAQAEPPNAQKETDTAIAFETAAQEAARKGEATEAERAQLLPGGERLARSAFQPHLRDEMERPHLKQRFPSRDIWEDSPDSAELTTTVGEGGTGAVGDPASEAGAVVHTSGRTAEGAVEGGGQDRIGVTSGSAMIPVRPSKSADQGVPDGSKPHVPARPARLSNDHVKGPQLTSDAPLPKPKPAIPPRPIGSKIAALQGGFMADLNSRLKLGPSPLVNKATDEKDKDKDKEEGEGGDRGPLSDARKGRAKGPAKRKPMTTTTATTSQDADRVGWGISPVQVVWESTSSGEIIVPGSHPGKGKTAGDGSGEDESSS